MTQKSLENTIDSGPQRLAVFSDQGAGIVIEAHNHAILSLNLLGAANNDGMPDVPSPYFVCSGCRASSWTAVTHGPRLLHDNNDAIAWRVVGTAKDDTWTYLTYQLCHVFSSVNLPRIPPRLHRSCQCNSALSGGHQRAVAYRSARRHDGIEKANLELNHDANCSDPAATDMQFASEGCSNGKLESRAK